jgi:hypothetical protein
MANRSNYLEIASMTVLSGAFVGLSLAVQRRVGEHTQSLSPVRQLFQLIAGRKRRHILNWLSLCVSFGVLLSDVIDFVETLDDAGVDEESSSMEENIETDMETDMGKGQPESPPLSAFRDAGNTNLSRYDPANDPIRMRIVEKDSFH